MQKIHITPALSTLLLFSALTLTACGGGKASHTEMNSAESTPSSTISAPAIKEGSTPSSRIALSYDGGIMIVDGREMKLIKSLPQEGFLRLNPSGDNRHITVADGSSYKILDAGSWEQPHGDHSHLYTADPTLSSLEFAADHTGHVITHHQKTAMFADGTGTFEVYNPAELTGENQRTAEQLKTSKVTLPQPHHGFAIPLGADHYLVAQGSEEKRTGAAVVDQHGKKLAENNQCPGVHGEAVAQDETITVGCEDGVLIYRDGTFTKIDNPEDPYSRSGNMAGSEKSEIVLADYKTDPDAELERPEQFALINTAEKTRTKVQLPDGVSYTFRSLARGPQGEALLLTTDGKLRYFDQHTGKELGSVDLMGPWKESETWQDPRPAIWVTGETAYITDPSTKKLMAVSLKNLQKGQAEKFAELELPETPNEISGVSGKTMK